MLRITYSITISKRSNKINRCRIGIRLGVGISSSAFDSSSSVGIGAGDRKFEGRDGPLFPPGSGSRGVGAVSEETGSGFGSGFRCGGRRCSVACLVDFFEDGGGRSVEQVGLEPIPRADDIAELGLDQAGALQVSRAEDVQRFLKVGQVFRVDAAGLGGERIEHRRRGAPVAREREDVVDHREGGGVGVAADHRDPGHVGGRLGGRVELGEVQQDALLEERGVSRRGNQAS